MLQRNASYLAVSALALTILLGTVAGCGGGGSNGGSSGGTDGGAPQPGAVVNSQTGVAVSGVKVTYYNAAGNLVGSETTDRTGLLRSVPSSATRFLIDPSALTYSYKDPASGQTFTDRFYDTYRYNGLSYDRNVGCSTPLPVPGSSSGFVGIISIYGRNGQIPAPPDGCISD